MLRIAEQFRWPIVFIIFGMSLAQTVMAESESDKSIPQPPAVTANPTPETDADSKAKQQPSADSEAKTAAPDTPSQPEPDKAKADAKVNPAGDATEAAADESEPEKDSGEESSEAKPEVVPASADQIAEQRLEQAVALARAGDFKAGLKKLALLIRDYPDYFPAKRDFIVVATWDKQCELAWDRFQAWKSGTEYEDYLAQPLSECLQDMRMYTESMVMLLNAYRRHPENKEIGEAIKTLKPIIFWQSRPELSVSLGSSESEKGAREWHFQTRYSHPLSRGNRVYARYLLKRATDPDFETANLNRVGLGWLSWLDKDDLLDIELTTDVKRGQEQGARFHFTRFQGRQWEFGLGYSSFFEDVPLRAKAQSIEANSANASAYYHSLDYKYECSAGAERNRFSDTNERRSYSGACGYAYELKPQREQRVLLELYQSDNTLDNVVYYNPEHDATVTLGWRADFVLDSKYHRHVQRVGFSVADHQQRNFQKRYNVAASYDIELEFARDNSFSLSARYGRYSYDGESENEGSINLAWLRKF